MGNCLKKAFLENERTDLLQLCEVGDAAPSERRCLRKNERAILKRTEKSVIRAMCGVKLIKKRRSEELMELLGLKEVLD